MQCMSSLKMWLLSLALFSIENVYASTLWKMPTPTMSSDPIRVFIQKEWGGGNFPNAEMCRIEDGGKGKAPNYPCRVVELIPGIKKRPLNRAATAPKKSYAYYFPPNRDVEVTVETPMELTKTISIWGGRQVRIRGTGNGHINLKRDRGIPAPCDQSNEQCKDALRAYKPPVNAVFVIESPFAAIWMENIKIFANGNFTDAVALRQNPATNPRPEGVDVFIRKFGAYDIGGAYAGLHGDIVQLQSGTYRNLFFFDIDGRAGYQGFFLPYRPKGSPYLCETASELLPEPNPLKLKADVETCLAPINVIGKAWFQNVVLRPTSASICSHCVKPYIGLYTRDAVKNGKTSPFYPSFLNDVTFYRDPRAEVWWYVVPHPGWRTKEGVIDMSKETNRVISGLLRIETEAQAE